MYSILERGKQGEKHRGGAVKRPVDVHRRVEGKKRQTDTTEEENK